MQTWTWTYLWTDLLVWLLVAMVVMFIVHTVRKAHLRAPWRKVFYRPTYLASAMVLALFIAVGLLDSIHLQFKDEQGTRTDMVSVLDLMLAPAKNHSESSYSAPFATHLFVKEAIETPSGKVERDYPRLKYGGAHLQDVSQKGQDIRLRILTVSAQTLILWAFVSIILLSVAAWRQKINFEEFLGGVIRGQASFPWRTFLLVLGLTLWCIMLVNTLMPYYHILGTSKIGEDVFYQSVKSIRTGLVIGTLTTLFMLPVAVLLGITAGYFLGKIDDVIQYLYTTLSSIPGVLLIASAVLILQVIMSQNQDIFQNQAQRSDARLLALCLILGLTSWTGLCRLLRAETLKLREIEFVQAARALGVRHFKIIFKHLLPNVVHILLISIALDFSGLVLAEAVLSYVGVGVDPASYSWGTMINSARLEMARVPMVWWSLSSAFIFMFALVLAANIFADAVRDAFDPRV